MFNPKWDVVPTQHFNTPRHHHWSPCLQLPTVTDTMATMHFRSFQPPSPGRPADLRQREQENMEMGKMSHTSSSLVFTLCLTAPLHISPPVPGAVILPYPLTDCTIFDGELISVCSAVGQQVLQPSKLSLQHPVLLLEGHDWGHGPCCWEKNRDRSNSSCKEQHFNLREIHWIECWDSENLQLSFRFFVTISRTRAGRHVGGASGDGPWTVNLFSSDKTLSSNLWCTKHTVISTGRETLQRQ